MKVCIIGCGAIGSIYGAHLAMHKDIEVWAYDKNNKHVDAINEKGLQLQGSQQLVAKVHATANPNEIPTCDLGIIATKTYHTRAAIEATAHLFENGVVCSLQNGVDNENIVAEYVDDVISGTSLAGGHISAPGTVNFDTNEMTWIGPAKGNVSMHQVQNLADLLSAKGLMTEAVEDPRSRKWTKLIFNAAANPLCALTQLPFGDMYRQIELRNLMYGLAEEGINVANALAINLTSNPIELLDKAAETAISHVPSMLSDVRSKQRTEIDALNGGVIKYGLQLGIACPINEAVLALVKGLESSW